MEQQAEQAARDERLAITERYTKSIAGLNATLKELNISVREVSDHVNHMQGLMDEKMSILIDEYIGELSLPMVHELVNLTLVQQETEYSFFVTKLSRTITFLKMRLKLREELNSSFNKNIRKIITDYEYSNINPYPFVQV